MGSDGPGDLVAALEERVSISLQVVDSIKEYARRCLGMTTKSHLHQAAHDGPGNIGDIYQYGQCCTCLVQVVSNKETDSPMGRGLDYLLRQ